MASLVVEISGVVGQSVGAQVPMHQLSLFDTNFQKNPDFEETRLPAEEDRLMRQVTLKSYLGLSDKIPETVSGESN